ncbi:hypothetical protein ACFXTO_024722 [Malus domestica]
MDIYELEGNCIYQLLSVFFRDIAHDTGAATSCLGNLCVVQKGRMS